nr:MAG: hypothetical protein [Chemarfal virus 36]
MQPQGEALENNSTKKLTLQDIFGNKLVFTKSSYNTEWNFPSNTVRCLHDYTKSFAKDYKLNGLSVSRQEFLTNLDIPEVVFELCWHCYMVTRQQTREEVKEDILYEINTKISSTGSRSQSFGLCKKCKEKQEQYNKFNKLRATAIDTYIKFIEIKNNNIDAIHHLSEL